MKILLAAIASVLLSIPASAQDVLRPPTVKCPEPDSLTCQLWPHICEDCIETPGDPPIRINVFPPRDPWLLNYVLPHTIGVTQIGHEGVPWPPSREYFSSLELANDVANDGFGALKLWMEHMPFEGMGPWCWNTYWGQEVCGDYNFPGVNMDEFWRNTPIKTIFLRPMWYGWTRWGGVGCLEGRGPVEVTVDFYSLAKRFYDEYWDQDLTIVLTDWEQDNMICEGYIDYFINSLNQRQKGVQRARREAWLEHGHRPRLRVMHAVILNKHPWNTDDYPYPMLAEMIPDLAFPPDLLGISYWKKGVDPIEILDWYQETTGYPRSRFYIDEFGAKISNQVQRFEDYIPKFWEWGINTVNIWLYKETMCDDNPRSLWEQVQPCQPGNVEFLVPSDGYYKLRELMWR